MRIAIDLSAVKTTGTKVYCAGFMPALGRLALDDEFLVFMPPEVADLIGEQLPDNFQRRITRVTNSVGLRILWEQIALPKYLQAWQTDILFSPFDIAPFAAPCPVFLAVRNPTPLLLAKRLLELRVEQVKGKIHRLFAYLSCRKAQCVSYPSHYAARMLGGLIGVPANKRVVVYHGTDYRIWSTFQEPSHILAQYHIESQRYVLFVSRFYPYKRPDVLIEGFATWSKMTNRADYKLVLVGGSPSETFERKLRQRVQELQLKETVLFLGHVPRTHVTVLYQQADVFALPTIMETFGHPFVEAMASGAPVICADTEFAHELCDNAALYFPPDDAEELARVFKRVIGQPGLRTWMKEAGRERAKMFSWEREARETLALMKQVGNDGGSALAVQGSIGE